MLCNLDVMSLQNVVGTNKSATAMKIGTKVLVFMAWVLVVLLILTCNYLVPKFHLSLKIITMNSVPPRNASVVTTTPTQKITKKVLIPRKVKHVQTWTEAKGLPPVCGNDTDFLEIQDFTIWNRPRVDLFMNIATAGKYYIRRKFIRNTWLSTVNKYSIAYRFFVDGIDIPSEERQSLLKEQEMYKDLEFSTTKPGYWFSHRYLFAMFWAYERYNFSFYMKVDDDYFVCLNNLQNDLQYRKHEKLLYWGFMRCEPNLVIIDEGLVIISMDLALEFMKRNYTLCCHPFADQMIAMFMNELESRGYNVTYFADNMRIAHNRGFIKNEHSNLCRDLIGIHQAYPRYMARYWNITKNNWFSIKPDQFVKAQRRKYNEYCSFPKVYDWRLLSGIYNHEPKPCWKPGLTWPELDHIKRHHSREEN